MESRRYLPICKRWWWLVLATILVTVTMTWVYVSGWARTYESTASFVIQPQAARQGDQVKALDALVRAGTVGETYASIARSQLIVDEAKAALRPSERRTPMSVSAEVVTGTRIVGVSVTGTNPKYARDLASAVSAKTVAYVNGLRDDYRLDRLDSPTLPTSPLSSRKSATIMLGAILGTLLGVGLASLADRVRGGPAPVHADAVGRGTTQLSWDGDSLWTPHDDVPGIDHGQERVRGSRSLADGASQERP
jgi:capsular polysaccharide biosynthesis protein